MSQNDPGRILQKEGKILRILLLFLTPPGIPGEVLIGRCADLGHRLIHGSKTAAGRQVRANQQLLPVRLIFSFIGSGWIRESVSWVFILFQDGWSSFIIF
ncbi:hypothetical protein SDC9_173031 [bioreactor metagenome]|uniref:Uncharacterized protein n=1 Tax=bioreactor metagenome TaxID=1076179 RepID=A0A645GIJ0_9ZZZZ